MVNEVPDNGIISPHAVCDSCGKNSGPILALPKFRDCIDFLRDNVIPTGNERDMTLQYIGKAEEQISQLDVEIDRLKQVTTSLRQQRNLLREFRNREKSLFAPIRKLPDDVLRHLFVTCQDDEFIRIDYRIKTCLTTIMNVCTHWRHVARSSPELCSRINIRNAKESSAGPKHVAIEQFFDACISYSREIPLTLQIEPPLQDYYMRNIARCAYRWKDINVQTGDLFSDIMKYVDPDLVLAHLERLSLRYRISSSISINPSPVLSYFYAKSIIGRSGLVTIVSFKSAPCLRRLSLENVFHPLSTFIDLPWGQITNFESTFNQYDINELALLLNSMPNLLSFTLEGEANIKETVTLPSLKTFMLPKSNVYNRDVLDAFTAPYLEILHSMAEMDPSCVFRFLTRSCCPLTDLQLVETFFDRKCIETCSSLRTVKKLCLVDPDPKWNDILVLTQEDRLSGLWSHLAFPQLQSLEMQWVKLEDHIEIGSDIIPPLIQMLKSRISPVQQIAGLEGDIKKFSYLQDVMIIFPEYLTLEETNAFYELNRSDILRQSGVIINICQRLIYDEYIIRNGVVVDEESTDSEESSSSEEDNTDSDDSTNSSQDTNTNSEETSVSDEESFASDT